MNSATIELLGQIFSVMVQAVQLGIKYGPELLADFERIFKLATSGTVLSDADRQQVATSLAEAHNLLQAQIALDAKTDAEDAQTETKPDDDLGND